MDEEEEETVVATDGAIVPSGRPPSELPEDYLALPTDDPGLPNLFSYIDDQGVVLPIDDEEAEDRAIDEDEKAETPQKNPVFDKYVDTQLLVTEE